MLTYEAPNASWLLQINLISMQLFCSTEVCLLWCTRAQHKLLKALILLVLHSSFAITSYVRHCMLRIVSILNTRRFDASKNSLPQLNCQCKMHTLNLDSSRIVWKHFSNACKKQAATKAIWWHASHKEHLNCQLRTQRHTYLFFGQAKKAHTLAPVHPEPCPSSRTKKRLSYLCWWGVRRPESGSLTLYSGQGMKRISKMVGAWILRWKCMKIASKLLSFPVKLKHPEIRNFPKISSFKDHTG